MCNLLSQREALGFSLRVGAYGLLFAILSLPLSPGNVSAGNLDVTVRQGTTTGPVVAGASVCIFQTNTTSQIGPTQMTDPNGFIRFVLGPTSQTVTVRAFASGNIRTENNVQDSTLKWIERHRFVAALYIHDSRCIEVIVGEEYETAALPSAPIASGLPVPVTTRPLKYGMLKQGLIFSL